MPIKVLMCVNHDVVIYNFRKELVQACLDQGYEVHISSPLGERLKPLEGMGAIVHPMEVDRKSLNPLKDFKLFKAYDHMIKNLKPNIVLTYTIKPNIYASFAAKKHHIPYIPNITGLGQAFAKKGLIQSITRMLYRKAFKQARVIFVQNPTHENFMNKLLPKANIKRLPGSGVNLDEYRPLPYPSEEVDQIRFGFIARIMKAKGIEEFMKAASNIKKTHPQTTFHIAGFVDGDYEDRIQEAHKQGLIHYHGLLKSTVDFMAKCHAVVLPSYHEGLSNVLLEAAACARPIISTKVPGCQETFIEGESGFGVPPKDALALEQAMRQFIALTHDEKKRMGMSGKAHVEKTFNRTLVVEAYLKVIQAI